MSLRKIAERDPLAIYLPDAAEWEWQLNGTVQKYLQWAIEHGAASLDAVLDVTNPHVIEWIQQYSGLMANRVSETVKDGIRQALIDGIEAGESSRVIRDRVLEAFGCERNEAGKIIVGDGLKYRAEMIARTEDHRAQTAGQRETARQMNATEIVWLAAPDACEFCQAIDGKVVGVRENFFGKGDRVSVTDDEGKERSLKLDYADVEGPPLHPFVDALCW